MLVTETFRDEIFSLYNQNKSAKEISTILQFKYHQPIYNFFKKYNLEHKSRIYQRKYSLNEDYFRCINTEQKAYILGFIAADGCVREYTLDFTLSVKDVHILEEIKKEINSDQLLRYSSRPNPYDKSKICKMVSLRISSTKFTDPLLKMGLGGGKTYTLDEKIMNFIPKYLIKDFLRGYFDGDGNVSFEKKYDSGTKYNINICGNKEFLLGSYQKYFPSSNQMYYMKKSKQTYVWKLSSKKNVENFLKWLYTNSKIHLKRKYKVYLISKYAHVKPI